MSIDPVQELMSIIMNFRVSELTQLLASFNLSKFGKKAVLQERALQLLDRDNLTQKVQFKIRELALRQGTHPSTYKSVCEIPNIVQDSSSNECTITDSPDMSQSINSYNNNSSNLPEYYSMPKSLGIKIGLCQSATKPNSTYHGGVNVKFKPIPFDEVIKTLIEPTVMPASKNKQRFNFSNSLEYQFKLTPDEANEVAMTREFKNNKFEFNSQIHLRFCQQDSYLPQDDHLPLNLIVKLNLKNIPLPSIIPNNKPNVESKRQSKPIDLTPFCKLSPLSSNHLQINWNQDANQKNFCFTVYLVRKLSSKDLLDKLNDKGPVDKLVTQKLIISKLTDTDNEISTTSLKGNLMCPLGKMRLRIPVRSDQCTHIQCFDAELYLQMNEKKPSWLCPVCDKRAEYKTLFIDGLFTQILKEAPIDSNEIEFTDDGGWKVVQNLNKTITLTPQRRKIEEVDTSSIKKSKPDEEEEVIELSSDSDDDNNENIQSPSLNMPKFSSFGDSNKSLNSFPSNLNSLPSTLNSLPSTLNSLYSMERGQTKNLITRPNSSHGTNNFGNFNFSLGGTLSMNSSNENLNDNNATMLRGCSSEVISID